ncbi:MAG: hypothetical protein C1943_06560 [Halochromatium sp.]|nr:hypothetical protein [Halochromatium sp.]
MAISNTYPARIETAQAQTPRRMPCDALLDAWPSQLLFLLILATIPFYKFRQIGEQAVLKVDWMLTAALIVWIVAVLLLTKSLPLRLRANFWPLLLLFLVSNSISTILSPYPEISVGGMTVLLQVIAFIAISLMMLNGRNIFDTVPWVITGSIALNSGLALLGNSFGIEIFIEQGRALGGTITANNMALMSVFAFPLSVYLVLYSRGLLAKGIALILLILILAGLVESGSRGGFVNFIIGFALLGWHFKSKLRVHYLGIVFAGIALMLAVFFYTVPQEYWERQSSLSILTSAVSKDPGHLSEDRSLERRTAYLVVVKESFFARPLIGFGTNTFHELWFLSDESDAFDNVRRPAHNTYAEILVGSGVIGLLLFLALLLKVYGNYRKAEHQFSFVQDYRSADLAAMYRIAFVSVLFYFFVKSGIDHKLFILAIAMSFALLLMSQEQLMRANSLSKEDRT